MTLITPGVQDVLVRQFNQELKFGKPKWPHGTDAKFFSRAAVRSNADMFAAAEAKRLTFADLVLNGTFTALATEDKAALRSNLVSLASELISWIDYLDELDELSKPVPA